MSKPFICDCGAAYPHGGEDCPYERIARAIVETMRELEEQKQSELTL